MARRRASLKDRSSTKKGRGVNAFFDGSEGGPPVEVRKTATFNLPVRQQDFLDEFVRTGKQRFRHENKVGVGAINKSAVIEVLINMLETDEKIKVSLIKTLERKDRKEGSRHDPRKIVGDDGDEPVTEEAASE